MSTRSAILEELRWQKFPVLDDGFVCLVDAMGDDQAIVQAARVSYGQGTRQVSDDRTLIRYLLRHRHTTPFEMAEVKLLVRVPMDCWRQWIRHRMASVNEYSTRYSIAIDATQATPADGWRTQSTTNAQGSGGLLDPQTGAELSQAEARLQSQARQIYQRRLELGVAREQARKDLPLSTYTEAYWKMDLNNLLHFLHLRMDEHAQFEIRQYATTIGRQIVQPLFPLVWEAYVDYFQHAMQLSRLDQGVIGRLAAAGQIPADEAAFLAAQDPAWSDSAAAASATNAAPSCCNWASSAPIRHPRPPTCLKEPHHERRDPRTVATQSEAVGIHRRRRLGNLRPAVRRPTSRPSSRSRRATWWRAWISTVSTSSWAATPARTPRPCRCPTSACWAPTRPC